MFVAWSAMRSRRAADENEPERPLDRGRVGHHVRQQDAKDRVAQPSASSSRTSTDRAPRDVLFEKRLHRVVEHGHGHLRQPADIDNRPERRQRDQPQGGLRDVHRLVADALEVGVHLDRRAHVPKVRRDRMLQRQQPERQVVDLELELVDS